MLLRITCLLLTALCLPLRSPAADSTPDCLDRVIKDIRVGDTVHLITTDGKVVSGRQPLMKIPPSSFYITSASDTGMAYYTIDIANIDHISYHKPSWTKVGLVCIGLTIGAVVGAKIGVEATPESTHDWDFPEVRNGIIGGGIGGLVGAILGQNLYINRTVQCGP